MVKRSPPHHERYIVLLIIIFFIGSLVSGSIGGMLATDSKAQVTLYQFSSVFFIAGCTVSGAKLTNEGWDIAAAGFTMLAISQGVYYASLLIQADQRLSFFSSGVTLFLPAMILIFFYGLFPLWVRVFGLISCIPFLLILICTLFNWGNKILLIALFISGFTLIDFTALFWSFFFWRNYRRKIR